MLLKGNYDQAITLAVKKISKDKSGKNAAEHILLLEEAYQKVVSQDNRRIDFLKNETSTEATRELFYIYKSMEARQNSIRPLLPLSNPVTGENATFTMVNYSQAMSTAKANFAAALYREANALMDNNTVFDYREAHEVLTELNNVQPGYSDVAQLLDDAHFYGTDFVLVTLNNRSNVIIPRRLEQELLDFNTYKLDDFWTEYHNQRQADIDYAFGIMLNFKEIAISPERITEKEYRRKKDIKDGFRYKLDRNGNKIKDENGDYITIDIFKKVTARVTHTVQSKGVLVGGDVLYRDLNGGRVIDKHPLASEFVFENVFAKFRGDERALTIEDRALLKNAFVPFPNNAQMVLDAGDDIKQRLKSILKDNSLR